MILYVKIKSIVSLHIKIDPYTIFVFIKCETNLAKDMRINRTKTDNGSRTWLQVGSKKYRLNRIIFSIVMILATLSVIWPGYALFSSATPLILGLPLSFAWIILWVIIGFAAMLALYFSDNKDPETD